MLSKRMVCFSVAVCALGGFGLAAAQEGGLKFQNIRWAEDWSQYPEEGIDSVFDPIKKIGLGENSWLSIGGEVRLRSKVWSDLEFAKANDDNFNLLRLFLHTDWHFGEHWRVFLQGKYTDAFTRDLPGGERDALDGDHGDIWYAFIEGNYTFDRLALTFRVGRQELQYGKQRLVSPLDWANNRRIFDSVVVSLAGTDKSWKLDGFVTAPVITNTNDFNDPNDNVILPSSTSVENWVRTRDLTWMHTS